jgi:hypothetical protein
MSLKVNDCILLERLIPSSLKDILVLGRQFPTYRIICTGPKCKKMYHNILEDVCFVVPTIPVTEHKVYTIPYLYPLDLGNVFP